MAPRHIAIIRAVTADLDRTLTMEHEALILASPSIATAARNHGATAVTRIARATGDATLHPLGPRADPVERRL